jgi:hypothetical protein
MPSTTVGEERSLPTGEDPGEGPVYVRQSRLLLAAEEVVVPERSVSWRYIDQLSLDVVEVSSEPELTKEGRKHSKSKVSRARTVNAPVFFMCFHY